MRTRIRTRNVLVALLTLVAILGASCSKSGDSKSKKTSSSTEEQEPQAGGTLRFALDAETSGGFCLPSATIGASGQYVATAVFDTLAKNNDEMKAVPWLAESITPNADYTQHTFVLREGVTFHDGTPLTAQSVVDNVEAWRASALMSFIYSDVSDVQAVDELTLTITTKHPWPQLPSWLADSRFGIIAPAQLESPDCATELIGTGPFKLESWEPDVVMRVVKNEDYWQDGLPYLDTVEFVPVPDMEMRVNQLQSGDVDMTHSPIDLATKRLLDLGEQDGFDAVRLPNTGVNFFHFNTSKEPFDDFRVREIVAVGVDRDRINETRLQGTGEVVDQHFNEGQLGHLDDCGYPKYDKEKAKKLVEAYEADEGPLKISFGSISDPIIKDLVEIIAQDLEDIGVETEIIVRDEATHIGAALAGSFEALAWREGLGDDPDVEYIWWKGGTLTNFSRFNDPVINEALDTGRMSADPAVRKDAYETINRRFCEKIYNGPLIAMRWGVGWKVSVHGVEDAELPDGNGKLVFRKFGPWLGAVWVEQ